MFNHELKKRIDPLLLKVKTPGQYVGGEKNSICKDHRTVKGKLCLAFPDAYTIGMSHLGLQVLYTLMNDREDWACERAFTPWPDFENLLREADLPLYALESFQPLSYFDVIGISLQYEVCYPNILTMLDLGGIPRHSTSRTMRDPLILAGGPCAQNPEPMAPFIDLFVSGDGEPSLPVICDRWLELRDDLESQGELLEGEAGEKQRADVIAQIASEILFCYAPRFYEPEYQDGRLIALNRTRPEVPETIEPSVISDFETLPIPTQLVVPWVQCVHERIAIEIMRGCPWQCRFCQSTVIKRPLRVRSVESIVNAAKEAYEATGHNEISILSLSSSDYPHFTELVTELKKIFVPKGVNVSVPSLRVNEQLRSIAELIGTERRSSLTLAPEVARDDMREQIRKKIKNEDLYEGCRQAFRNGFESVKLYFMCGLPGERPVDLDGIIEMAETIARIGKEEKGRYPKVTASVSNFVPKAHTPYQWNGMQTPEYFRWAHQYLFDKKKLRAVQLKCHDTETSLLEGVLSRGDRRMAAVIERAWLAGARMDAWNEEFNSARWWQAMREEELDRADVLHRPYEMGHKLPWDHVNVKYGRPFLEKEQTRSVVQLTAMADAK